MYNLLWDRRTEKDLRAITPAIGERIVRTCHEILSANPHVGRALTGNHKGLYRLRIGDYRVLYTIFEETITVRVVKATPFPP